MDLQTLVEVSDFLLSSTRHFAAGPSHLFGIVGVLYYFPDTPPFVALSACHELPLAAALALVCTHGVPDAL